MTPLSWFFEQLFPSISWVSTKQWRICVENYSETHEVRGNPPRMRIWNQWWYRQNFLLLTLFSQTDAEVQGNLLREYEQKFAELPEQEKLTKLCSNAGFSKNIDKGQFFIALDDACTKRSERTMSRVSFTSKWRIIPRERVDSCDSWKHEDRPSPGCEGLWSSRTLRCGDHDRIFISRQNCFLRSHRERN